MARFGLLMLNKGKWDDEVILNQDYFEDATNTSQNINLIYLNLLLILMIVNTCNTPLHLCFLFGLY